MDLTNYQIDRNQIDRSIPIPLYYQLKTILLKEIECGNFPVGTTIPTENVLSTHFQISRSTVRQAISELVREGRLTRKTCKGTIVTSPPENIGSIRSFEPFYQQVAKSGKTPRTEVLHLEIILANDLAHFLNLEPTDKVISMFRRRLADDTPMVTMQNYLPHTACAFILNHNFEKESLHEVLAANTEFKNSVTKTIVSAVAATEEDAKMLDTEKGSPILNFTTTRRTGVGMIIDYAFSRYRGDLNRFEIDASSN